MKNKTKSKGMFLKVRFLVTVLVLSGGLLAGAKLVSQNQENRTSAATIYYGVPIANNTLECRNAGGICAKFSAPLTSSQLYGGIISVNGVGATLLTGLCAGDWRTVCSYTGQSCYVGSYRIPNATKFCNTSARTRVYVCDAGRIVYRGLDCASKGQICENGNCVTKLSGTGTGAAKCVARGGNCQTNYSKSGYIVTPPVGSVCMTGNKLGKFVSSLCEGQYTTSYRCCVPN